MDNLYLKIPTLDDKENWIDFVKEYVEDNHSDYYNGINIKIKRNIIKQFYYYFLQFIYIFINKISIKHVSKVYGTTPWRVDYASDFFHIPKEKLDILIMGADDEKINFENKNQIRSNIRNKYNISETDFLIISGGKIDLSKNIHLLIKAVNELNDIQIKLLIFGSLCDDVKEQINELVINNKSIRYIGWIPGDKAYDYFLASDIAIFPGTHSVLWEQACACKIPVVFKRWEGMMHVDVGGNAKFINNVSIENIKRIILELKFTEDYELMRSVSLSKKTDVFLYSNIAKKSIETTNVN